MVPVHVVICSLVHHDQCLVHPAYIHVYGSCDYFYPSHSIGCRLLKAGSDVEPTNPMQPVNSLLLVYTGRRLQSQAECPNALTMCAAVNSTSGAASTSMAWTVGIALAITALGMAVEPHQQDGIRRTQCVHRCA